MYIKGYSPLESHRPGHAARYPEPPLLIRRALDEDTLPARGSQLPRHVEDRGGKIWRCGPDGL